jgi:hypothetical protein
VYVLVPIQFATFQLATLQLDTLQLATFQLATLQLATITIRHFTFRQHYILPPITSCHHYISALLHFTTITFRHFSFFGLDQSCENFVDNVGGYVYVLLSILWYCFS